MPTRIAPLPDRFGRTAATGAAGFAAAALGAAAGAGFGVATFTGFALFFNGLAGGALAGLPLELLAAAAAAP
jgi:hypothetical protein